MRFTILDCYTDEPAGLGVPPYIGTYPRYIAGAITRSNHEVFYLNIDDLRFFASRMKSFKENLDSIPVQIENEKHRIKTIIRVRNLSKNILNIRKILYKTDILVVIAGIHTPGRYLSAFPGTTEEVMRLLNQVNYGGFTLLTGPAAELGSGLWGGRLARDVSRDFEKFDLLVPDLEFKIPALIENKFAEDPPAEFSYRDLTPIAIAGATIAKEHPNYPDFIIAEIETSKGCPRIPGCSFCTEPIKLNKIERRTPKEILNEIQALSAEGIKNFRLGKQSCFYSYGSAADIEKLLKAASAEAEVLHIDNVNPAVVTEEKTKLIVNYCTAGNIAAFGVESFDPVVIEANHLNAAPETTYNAVTILNKYGAARGDNGMPKFLPGINLIFGLIKESQKTHEANLHWLKKILNDGLLLRRINIREVVIFPGTLLSEECGNKYLRKNKKFYWKWRNEIRQQIDAPMLKKVVPTGTRLPRIKTEICDGNITFGRQIGTYPLIVGIKRRLELDQFIEVKVTDHMLRSVVAEKI